MLKDIVEMHKGNTHSLLEFLDYSKCFKEVENSEAKIQFSKIINSFAKYQLHKEQYIDWKNYDFTKKFKPDYADQLWLFS